tara:strand:- start:902 stop:1414 length:513 start_codon:yes stop_codon:yes gene_type:complete
MGQIFFILSFLLITPQIFSQETGELFHYRTPSGYKWMSVKNDKYRKKYKGEIKNGVPNGFGIQFYKNGDTYFGEHKNGFPNGKGRAIYNDGAIYLGEYKNGKFHGKGKFIWKDGYFHEGEFKNGTPNGEGTETLPNGQLKGEYKNGKPWNAIGYDKEGEVISNYVNGVLK